MIQAGCGRLDHERTSRSYFCIVTVLFTRNNNVVFDLGQQGSLDGPDKHNEDAGKGFLVCDARARTASMTATHT